MMEPSDYYDVEILHDGRPPIQQDEIKKVAPVVLAVAGAATIAGVAAVVAPVVVPIVPVAGKAAAGAAVSCAVLEDAVVVAGLALGADLFAGGGDQSPPRRRSHSRSPPLDADAGIVNNKESRGQNDEDGGESDVGSFASCASSEHTFFDARDTSPIRIYRGTALGSDPLGIVSGPGNGEFRGRGSYWTHSQSTAERYATVDGGYPRDGQVHEALYHPNDATDAGFSVGECIDTSGRPDDLADVHEFEQRDDNPRHEILFSNGSVSVLNPTLHSVHPKPQHPNPNP